MNKNKIFAVAAIVAVLIAGGCSIEEDFKSDRGRGDAPVLSSDDSGAEVINFPNNFPNVAHKCDGNGHRVYVTTYYGENRMGQVVVVGDESC